MVQRLLLAALMLAFGALPAAAEMSDAERASRWADLSHALFGDRALIDAGEGLTIEAPARAADAALVPIALHLAEPLARDVRTLYLVIDNNPSPLAAVFHFGALADAGEVATRVRIDDYTNLHAIAETADGRLFLAQRFIKATGGCSAPAGSDAAVASARLGKMKLRLASPAQAGGAMVAQLLISHPNSSGLQMDQLTHNYIPADFIQQVHVTAGGTEVLTIDADIAVSEDPSFRFGLRPGASGEIKVEAEDNQRRHFAQSWPISAPAD